MPKIQIPTMPSFPTTPEAILAGMNSPDNDTINGTVALFMEQSGVTIDLSNALPQYTGFGYDTFASTVATVFTGSGNDVVTGNANANFLVASYGNDMLSGGAGNDVLFGAEGNDTLNGGDGTDFLVGGEGKDVLTGGNGIDYFAVMKKPMKGANTATVTDFKVKQDKFILTKSEFNKASSSKGILKESNFYKSAGATKAHDQDDRIVFNTKTGKLYYDADGAGGKGAELIATLKMNGTLKNLSHKDFYI
jgi:Ca2+-binding RTX toxin-like protein